MNPSNYNINNSAKNNDRNNLYIGIQSYNNFKLDRKNKSNKKTH